MARWCSTGDEHCCWMGSHPGGVCMFLKPGGSERRWVCTLRRDLGSWAAVHADPRYLAHVRPVLDREAQADCGDWPGPGVTCAVCGQCGDDNG